MSETPSQSVTCIQYMVVEVLPVILFHIFSEKGIAPFRINSDSSVTEPSVRNCLKLFIFYFLWWIISFPIFQLSLHIGIVIQPTAQKIPMTFPIIIWKIVKFLTPFLFFCYYFPDCIHSMPGHPSHPYYIHCKGCKYCYKLRITVTKQHGYTPTSVTQPCFLPYGGYL